MAERQRREELAERGGGKTEAAGKNLWEEGRREELVGRGGREDRCEKKFIFLNLLIYYLYF
jgi:hypothetical protein